MFIKDLLMLLVIIQFNLYIYTLNTLYYINFFKTLLVYNLNKLNSYIFNIQLFNII